MNNKIKTPVSILQEMMVKNGTVPHYELIYDGGGTHENTFTYQVSCQGLVAIGTGRCKKDAKHLAANNMLERIAAENNYPALPPIPDDKSPAKLIPPPRILSDEPFVNAIGELQDMCAEVGLPDPIYETVGDQGPAHAKIFTIHCKIFTLIEEGTQTTKKHAKHLAARKMYDRVKNMVENTVNIQKIVKAELEEHNVDPDSNNEIVPVNNDDFIDFSKLSFYSKSSLGLKLSEFHTTLFTSNDDITRETVISELTQFSEYYLNDETDNDDTDFYSYLKELKNVFNDAISPLNISAVVYSFPTRCETSTDCIITIVLNSVPELVECVVGKSEDKKLLLSLFVRITKTLTLLLIKC
ncbi:interferon-inducible double-stranded RNA-dependent protein kinase activator A homolog B-like [Cotesia glomerata]|uniref:DRBM domain-containing protein n=1 Tax=Cotesia glomerata TaxID=32391 RepID=A0AAV7HWN6_COTGL|nr:interferon-inducible double-stranded RNA-dependent protein kinase activator A homolog B-like [Cotesia glomerata]XP_044576559.1 interferon-inducible double-stranded RNA-dependent protein kinase activator A homolog B-like [Cotesia glomerata]KAH0539182.1 hypothetical protein KQX54_001690 [Cotesia glomerata]